MGSIKIIFNDTLNQLFATILFRDSPEINLFATTIFRDHALSTPRLDTTPIRQRVVRGEKYSLRAFREYFSYANKSCFTVYKIILSVH